jgi:hypothetical protein
MAENLIKAGRLHAMKSLGCTFSHRCPLTMPF